MLKGISPLLSPELLQILRAMGHGDTLALVDANFPADALARRLVRLDGHSATEVLSKTLQLLPVDDFIDHPLQSMAVVGDEANKPKIVVEFERIASAAEGRVLAAAPLSREQFYSAAKNAYAIVATGERRLYGNLLITKGVVKCD